MKTAPILGPCRCRGCGEPLWWTKLANGRVAWREGDGARHTCPDYDRVEASRVLLQRLSARLSEARAS